MEFYTWNMMYDFRPKTDHSYRGIEVGKRVCEYPLRVNRVSAYAGSIYLKPAFDATHHHFAAAEEAFSQPATTSQSEPLYLRYRIIVSKDRELHCRILHCSILSLSNNSICRKPHRQSAAPSGYHGLKIPPCLP